jgi:integrase
MATVLKDSRGRSPYWIAQYKSADGRWLKKSTKLTNKRKALEMALALDHGEHLARTGHFTEDRLRTLLEQTLSRVTGEPVERHTVATWFAWWHERKALARPDSAERYGQVVRDFISFLGSRAQLPLEHITGKDVLAFRSHETKRGLSNKSANLAVKIISMGFHDALRQGKIKFNPCLGLDALEEETVEREPFTPSEISRLIQATQGDWRRAILFAYFTGARLTDTANMVWSAIDRDKHLVTFMPKKTRRRKKVLQIPLHPDLEKELRKCPGIGLAPLFPTLHGRKSSGAHGLSSEFASIMRKAGVHGEIIKHTEKGRRNSTKSFHSLRHSFNSALANAGVSREVRQVLTGHASERMNEIYTHHELETVRSAIAVIPAL